MNNYVSFRRVDRCVRRLGVLFLIGGLCACAGESKNDDIQSGKIERSADVSGRWSLNYAGAANSCGFPQTKSQVMVEALQDGANVAFQTLKGAPLLQGSITGGTFTSTSSATLQIDGRDYSYTQETQLAIENNTLVGQEVFSFANVDGELQCAGKTRINAVRSVSRKNVVVPNEALVDFEPNDTVLASVALPVNMSVTGVVDAGSDRVDVYALPLLHSGIYQIGMTGFGNSDLDIALVDKFQNLLATSEKAFGLDEGVEFSVDAANNAMLYVIVSGFETGDTASDYTLQVTAP